MAIFKITWSLGFGHWDFYIMTIFCYKKVTPPMRLGEIFQKAREEKNLDRRAFVRLTQIPEKYLIAIEEGKFNFLPKAKAHRLAYIRSIAKVLELPADECIVQFEKEAGLDNADLAHPLRSIKLFPIATISIFIRNLAIASLAIFFVGYLGWQVRGVLQPPYLAVFTPVEGNVVTSPRPNILGETEKETRLTVNGQEIMVNEQGQFSADVDLSGGVNTIQISATKKHGKTTTIVRHVVVRLLPTATTESKIFSLK